MLLLTIIVDVKCKVHILYIYFSIYLLYYDCAYFAAKLLRDVLSLLIYVFCMCARN